MERANINVPRDLAGVDQWQRAVEDIFMKVPPKEIESVIQLASQIRSKNTSPIEVMLAYFALYGWNAMVMTHKERSIEESAK